MESVSTWTAEDVVAWVEDCLHLPYGKEFAEASVDGTALLALEGPVLLALTGKTEHAAVLERRISGLRALSKVESMRRELGSGTGSGTLLGNTFAGSDAGLASAAVQTASCSTVRQRLVLDGSPGSERHAPPAAAAKLTTPVSQSFASSTTGSPSGTPGSAILPEGVAARAADARDPDTARTPGSRAASPRSPALFLRARPQPQTAPVVPRITPREPPRATLGRRLPAAMTSRSAVALDMGVPAVQAGTPRGSVAAVRGVPTATALRTVIRSQSCSGLEEAQRAATTPRAHTPRRSPAVQGVAPRWPPFGSHEEVPNRPLGARATLGSGVLPSRTGAAPPPMAAVVQPPYAEGPSSMPPTMCPVSAVRPALGGPTARRRSLGASSSVGSLGSGQTAWSSFGGSQSRGAGIGIGPRVCMSPSRSAAPGPCTYDLNNGQRCAEINGGPDHGPRFPREVRSTPWLFKRGMESPGPVWCPPPMEGRGCGPGALTISRSPRMGVTTSQTREIERDIRERSVEKVLGPYSYSPQWHALSTFK